MMLTSMDDKVIMKKMAEQPEEGFRLLMAKYKEKIYWFVRRLVSSHADAQDASQETFVRIYRSFGQFRNECAFSSWIYRIATNEALRILNKYKDGQVSIDNDESAVTDVMADDYVDYSDLEAVKLQRAIQSLPPKQQLAFHLRYYDELEYGEIAEVLESTPAAAKANYHWAKEKIVQYMNSHD